ncbi:MAG TPA: protein translocase subunit SecD [Actinomycetota bacterium]|nr:protein translocase subunit SecD [Actinomycetota bacterium]
MRRNRALWVSIVFVVLLVTASAIGFFRGALRPTLGLDLQGGASVILSAPEGTPDDVMQQALENIRNRVDAFGVGEPDIAVSGTTIEVQIPGSADATIRRRSADLSCLEGDGKIHGCSENDDDVRDVLDSLEVQSQPSEVCVLDGGGEQVECFTSRAQAQTFLDGIEVVPKEEASPSATASPSAQPTGSPSPEGPAPAASGYCLNNPDGEQITCFDSRREAQSAKNAMKVRVTDRSFCIVPVPPEPSPTPSPSASASGTPTPSASASPSASPSPTPATLNDLDLAGADPLPCEIASKEKADAALAAITITPQTHRFCVISSGGEQLGCSVQRSKAEELRRQSGQERLLRVIGETARLEERRVREIVPVNDPRPITCAAEEEQNLPRCTDSALQDDEVVFAGPSPAGQGVAKFVLGPVVISGDDFDSARAVLAQSGQLGASTEWTVTFQLDSDGADRFATATTEAVGAPPPTDQIAIIVDRVVISSPTVQSAITGGSGEITGGFSEQQARDLATQLNAGALPVELTRQSVRTVSPTLGDESLREGIIAGLAGLLLLFAYLLFYYRLLGVVAWLGMTIWAALAIALVSIAGDQFGYALSLAGVAGLVISLGVTADSYIVFFERLKDEVRSGKSARAAVRPAFARAYKTIVAADIVTGLAAVALYLTAVSSVRGFALTLGVATLLDLFVVWFFKRPTIFLIANNEKLVGLRGFGLESGVAAEAQEEGAGL